MLQDLVQGQFDDTLLTVDLVVTHKFRYYVYINNKNIKIATAGKHKKSILSVYCYSVTLWIFVRNV
jgi:hypothetical protein